MPNEKVIQMQSMSLYPPFDIIDISMSMIELKQNVDRIMDKALEILSKPEEGALSFECVSDDDNSYVLRVQKLASNKFAWWNVMTDNIEILDSRNTLRQLYHHIPLTDIVGIEMGADVLRELARREKDN